MFSFQSLLVGQPILCPATHRWVQCSGNLKHSRCKLCTNVCGACCFTNVHSRCRNLPSHRRGKSFVQAAAATSGPQLPLPPPPKKRLPLLQQQRQRLSNLRRDAEIAAVAALAAAALSFDISPAAFADPPGALWGSLAKLSCLHHLLPSRGDGARRKCANHPLSPFSSKLIWFVKLWHACLVLTPLKAYLTPCESAIVREQELKDQVPHLPPSSP